MIVEVKSAKQPLSDQIAGRLASMLIGREDEVGMLSNLLKKARNGLGSFVVIDGETGVGKTTLIKSLLQAQDGDEIVSVSESFKGVRSHEPYLPFIRIVEKINKEDSSAPHIEITEKANSGLVKEGLNSESLYAAQSRQNVVKQQILSNVLTSAKDRVLIILLNDAQIAPLTSWKFIHYLSENIHESNILLIATLCQGSNEQHYENQPAYVDVLQRMNREGIVHRILLEPFGEGELKEYVRTAFPCKDFSSRLLPLLYEASAGVPGQIYHLITRLLEDGIIFQYEGVWVDRGNLRKDDFLNLLDKRQNSRGHESITTGLPDHQQDLLALLSLLDEPFNHRILSAAAELNRIKVLKELLSLQELGILSPFGEGSYKFSSPKFKMEIASRISESDKTSKHLHIANKIETAENIEYGDKVFCLAYHYHMANDKIRAFRYMKAASEIAVENFAFLEALEFIRKALDLSSHFSAAEHRIELAQLFIWAAWLDRILGNLEDSTRNCEAAIGLLEDEEHRLLKNQALIQLGFTYFRLNDWDNSLRCFNECLDREKGLGQLDKAMAKYGLGNVHFELADYEKSYQHFEAALELAEALQANQLVANVFNNLGALENVRSHRMRAIALYSKSIPIFRALGDDFGLARVYHNIGMTHADDNNWQLANEFYGQSLLVSDVMGLVPLKSITFLNRAQAFANLDNLHEAREYNVKAYRLLVSLKDELGIAEYNKVQGIIERKGRNWDAAREHFELALGKFKHLQNKLGLAESASEFAVLELQVGNIPSAMEKLDLALTNYRTLSLMEKAQSVQNQIDELTNSDKRMQKEMFLKHEF
jgi:tetratricopeptide (TPR) repeat protein/nucleoside-triphosphatase THEP1